MSVGILTSGGDAPGMNAAVRAAFRSLKMRAPDSELILFRDGFRGLARRLDSASDRSVDRKDVRDIIHRGGTFIGTGRTDEKNGTGDVMQQSRIGTLEKQVMELQRVVDEWQQAYNGLHQQYVEATGREPM